jgi:hypothetical protein
MSGDKIVGMVPPLQELKCKNCGGALPANARPGITLTCAHCGTPYRVPEMSKSGGAINFSAGGDLSIGEFVGGDKIVIHGSLSPGLAGALTRVHRLINARPEDPDVDKDELKDLVGKIFSEVAQGDAANATRLRRWLQTLANLAEDIFRPTAAALVEQSLPAFVQQLVRDIQ